MTVKQEATNKILLWLWNASDAENRDSLSSTAATRINRRVETKFNQYESEKHLEEVLSGDRVDFGSDNRFLFLPYEIGKTTGTISILSVQYDFGVQPPPIRLRLVTFVAIEIAGKYSAKSFGFRFESPEQSDRHHYFHAQPIVDVDDFPLDLPSWYPDDNPTIPIDALDPPSLLISALISIYGLDIIRQLRTINAGGLIHRAIEQMAWTNL